MALYRRQRNNRGRGSISVRLDIDPPARKIIRRYNHLRYWLEDLRPVWDELIPVLRKAIPGIIASRGASAGRPWKALDDEYASRRGGYAIMIATGKLISKISTDGVLSRTRRRLKFGVRYPGIASQQFGSPKQGIPARPVFVVTQQLRETTSRAINRHLDKEFARWGVGRASANATIARKT